MNQGLAARPGVLPAAHGPVTEVGVAVHARVGQHLPLDGDRPFEEVGVPLRKADPFGFALVEAEVATGPGSPLVVGREPDARVREDAQHPVVVDVVLDEGEAGFDVGLGGDIALAVGFISPDRHVGDGGVVADPGFDGLDLHVSGAPPHLRRREGSPENLEPVVEAALGVEVRYRLAEDHLQTGQILVGLG